MKNLLVTSSLILTTLLALIPASAFAYTIPDFPTCSNPPNVIKVSYDEGIHGIVGETGTYEGSDVVYNLDDGNNIQCFCADHGGGIQTNWWRANSLSQDEKDTLVKLGWIYVPSGAEWGLESIPYLAKNNDYSCGADNQTGGGEVLSTSTESTGTGGAILGLASTGGNGVLVGYLALGVAMISGGVLLRKRA